jgi:hypothetical protein
MSIKVGDYSIPLARYSSRISHLTKLLSQAFLSQLLCPYVTSILIQQTF